MKKLLLIFVVIGLSQCQVKIEPKSASAQEFPTYYIASPPRGFNGESKISVTVYKKDGIEYRIFTNDTYDGKSIFVVNHTKELLEIELLKQKLKDL